MSRCPSLGGPGVAEWPARVGGRAAVTVRCVRPCEVPSLTFPGSDLSVCVDCSPGKSDAPVTAGEAPS